MEKTKVAIIGSGNIGTDLMIKILRLSKSLEMSVMVGIDAESDGLARAKRMGVKTCHTGIDGLVEMPEFNEVQLLFDATSAKAHQYNNQILQNYPNKKIIDLTPAAIGPFIVPAVNMDELAETQNVNMVTCGGQATIPMVAAVSNVAKVHYAEIVASIASKSAGPGTRANIDEFTETTARAIEKVGKADKGKAIIILNPAEPPLIMRDTIFTFSEKAATEEIRKSVGQMLKKVQQYVPGYTLKQEVQFDEITPENPIRMDGKLMTEGLKITIMLEIKGAGHYLPEYAGNLDIMTSAAMAAGEKLLQKELQ